jgi:hypothetical protein
MSDAMPQELTFYDKHTPSPTHAFVTHFSCFSNADEYSQAFFTKYKKKDFYGDNVHV